MNNESKLPVCPFYVKATYNRVYCEGGTFKIPDPKARHELISEYCSDMENYKNCTICRMLVNYYDRQEGADNEQK